jgi:microcystin degradation protein MlrC
LDGVAVSLHGATMAENSDDVCGDILTAIRKKVGERVPIAAAFDLHANVTERILRSADYICGFLEYPHIDQFETGQRAAKLLLDHLDGQPAKTAAVKIPMIAPAHGYTTKEGGLLALVNKAKEMVSSGRILDYTVFEVQPWLDTPTMASTIITVAKDEKTAKEAARELALENLALREELLGTPLLSVDAVIQKALNNKSGKPVILVDSADSRGAGSTADSAAVLEFLLPYADRLRCAVGVSDAPAVEQAFALGVGGVGDFTLGATVSPSLSKPVNVKGATVRSLHAGTFTNYGPIGKGWITNCGRVAVLQVGKILIQVSTSSRTEKDLGFYRGFGIEPAFCDLVSVKACTSFRDAYSAISAEICNTATPGAAGTVLTELPYQKRPVPLYPFEEIGEADVTEAVCYR